MRSTALPLTFFVILFVLRGAAAQVVADHLAVDRFEAIPESALRSAAALRLMFRHASVGGTIGDGLDCVQGTRDNPSECRIYPDYTYDRRNWAFQPRGNSGWYSKVDDFVAETERQLASFDAFSFKYCYLDGLDGLMEPCGSPQDPTKVDRAWEYLLGHMEALEAAHPDKVFIWWTIPLTQVGQSCTEVLNEKIRLLCAERGNPGQGRRRHASVRVLSKELSFDPRSHPRLRRSARSLRVLPRPPPGGRSRL